MLLLVLLPLLMKHCSSQVDLSSSPTSPQLTSHLSLTLRRCPQTTAVFLVGNTRQQSCPGTETNVLNDPERCVGDPGGQQLRLQFTDMQCPYLLSTGWILLETFYKNAFKGVGCIGNVGQRDAEVLVMCKRETPGTCPRRFEFLLETLAVHSCGERMKMSSALVALQVRAESRHPSFTASFVQGALSWS